MAEGEPQKKARLLPRLPVAGGVAHRSSCTTALRGALLAEGATWHPKLRRSWDLQVPGLVVDEATEPGTVLLKIPRDLHFSRPRCQETFEEIYTACEALPSADPEKREDAADALCLAQLLQDATKPENASPAPSTSATWKHMAEVLLSEDFSEHPYVAACERQGLEIPSSAEPELITAQADYVRTVFGCLCSLPSGKDLDEGLFLQAWLCLLTRRFRGPEGSALVPGVDFLNHSWDANASSDWDEESGSIMVTATRHLNEGEEVFISYGSFSNPLLFRTYGFTLPSSLEPCRTCTFTEEELLETAPMEVAADLQSLPNLHLNSSMISDELAVLLQVWPGAGQALRQLCRKRMEEVDLKVKEMQRRWSEDPSNAEGIPLHHDHGLRIAFSEYLCVLIHADILDELAGQSTESKEPVELAAKELRREFQVIQEAGMLILEEKKGLF